jgi:hypothetical protein
VGQPVKRQAALDPLVKPMTPPAVPSPANDATILIFKADVVQVRTTIRSLERTVGADALAATQTVKASNAVESTTLRKHLTEQV